jgi:hypothetical protein
MKNFEKQYLPKPEERSDQEVSKEAPGIKRIREVKISEFRHLPHLGIIEKNLDYSAKDIQQLTEILQAKSFTDTERDAVQRAIRGLDTIRVIQDRLSVLKRYTRYIEELAIASLVVDRIPYDSCNQYLRSSINQLVNAVHSIASPDEQKEAGKIMGMMNDEEIAKRREELMKHNVS